MFREVVCLRKLKPYITVDNFFLHLYLKSVPHIPEGGSITLIELALPTNSLSLVLEDMLLSIFLPKRSFIVASFAGLCRRNFVPSSLYLSL